MKIDLGRIILFRLRSAPKSDSKAKEMLRVIKSLTRLRCIQLGGRFIFLFRLRSVPKADS